MSAAGRGWIRLVFPRWVHACRLDEKPTGFKAALGCYARRRSTSRCVAARFINRVLPGGSSPVWGKGFVDQAEEPLSAVHADFRVDVFGVGTHGVL